MTPLARTCRRRYLSDTFLNTKCPILSRELPSSSARLCFPKRSGSKLRLFDRAARLIRFFDRTFARGFHLTCRALIGRRSIVIGRSVRRSFPVDELRRSRVSSNGCPSGQKRGFARVHFANTRKVICHCVHRYQNR